MAIIDNNAILDMAALTLKFDGAVKGPFLNLCKVATHACTGRLRLEDLGVEPFKRDGCHVGGACKCLTERFYAGVWLLYLLVSMQ